MDWLKKILDNAKITDGVLDVDSVVSSINAEFPKHAMPKEKFNDVNSQLKEANKMIDELKTSNADNQNLLSRVKEYETKISDLESDAVKREKEFEIKTALTNAGANDVDYALFKFGDVKEFDIKNLDNKIKELKEQIPNQFKTIEENAPKIIANKIDTNLPNDGAVDDITAQFAKGLTGSIN